MNTTATRMTLVLAAAVLAGACASQDEKDDTSTQDITQAVRDYIEVHDLKEVDRMRTGGSNGWRQIDERFILYEGRRDTYLVEFVRRCYELNDRTRIAADKRWDMNEIRARFDTIRGCRIAKIYELNEAEIAELENIGDAPGEHG